MRWVVGVWWSPVVLKENVNKIGPTMLNNLALRGAAKQWGVRFLQRTWDKVEGGVVGKCKIESGRNPHVERVRFRREGANQTPRDRQIAQAQPTVHAQQARPACFEYSIPHILQSDTEQPSWVNDGSRPNQFGKLIRWATDF